MGSLIIRSRSSSQSVSPRAAADRQPSTGFSSVRRGVRLQHKELRGRAMSHIKTNAQVLLFTAVTAAAAVSAACPVSFTPIDVPGANSYFVSGISDVGFVVGSSSTDNGSTFTGFIRSPSGAMTTGLLDPNDVDAYTVLHSINDRGVIAGFFSGVTVPGHGLLLVDGSFTTFDIPGAAGGTALRGINNRGDLAGTFSKTAANLNADQFGFIVPNVGASIIFQLPNPAAGGLVVEAINDLRVVVGYYTAPSSTLTGFLRQVDGRWVDIVVPGADATQVYGINNCGIIAGTYASGGTLHGFFGHPGNLQTFDVPGANVTHVQGINNRGRLVGVYATNGVTHAYVTSVIPAALCAN
jgi:hypothetical protein